MTQDEIKEELDELDDLIVARLNALQAQVDLINSEVGLLKELHQRRLLKREYLHKLERGTDRKEE